MSLPGYETVLDPLGHRMTKRLEYLHFCRFLVVCQGSLRIWAYHIQAVKLNGKSIDQDNLWNKDSQPSQYEAACPNAPSLSTFRDAVLTSRHDTESIYHGRFSGFGGLGACNMVNPSSANSDHGTSKPPCPRGNQESLFFLLSTVCLCLLDTWRVPVFVLGGFVTSFPRI